MKGNLSKRIAGICFLLGTVFCIFSIVQSGVESYYLTGLLVFTLVGVGLLRSSRR